jgi:hypothetical protein
MPSVGLLDGTTVYPGGVSDTTDVLCPKCSEPMHVRGGPQTDRLRHFAHYPQNRKCSGETQEHHQWKQLVFRALSNLDLPHQESLFFCLEGEIDVSNTPSEAARRRADVLLRFGDEHDNFGHGIAIEIQHRNDDKNVHAVTYDYLVNGYSVRWASRHDFTDNAFDAAAVIADSDSHPMFFREAATTSLPGFDEFCHLDFADLADLLDGTQSQLPSFTDLSDDQEHTANHQ